VADVVGKHGGDLMVPHIAMMQARQRHKPKVAPATRRATCHGLQDH
jgi:hypothetical protein